MLNSSPPRLPNTQHTYTHRMAANYPAGYMAPRGRPEDDIYAAQPAINPFAYDYDAGAAAGPGGAFLGRQGSGYYATAAATQQAPPMMAPPAATVPAYAVATPAAAAAYPMAQAGLVHTASSGSMMGGGYGAPAPPMYGGGGYGGYAAGGGGYYAQQPQVQQPQPARPPRNHAAGPRTQFQKPPPPPVFGANPDIEAGSFSQPNAVTQFTQTAETQMRHAFIRKVYSVLCLQLIASFGLLAYLTYDGAAQAFVLGRPGLAYTAMALSFVMLMLLLCYRQSYPTNLGLLALWTLVEAYTISIVTCTYARAGEGEMVLQALGITALLFIALTVFTLQRYVDLVRLKGSAFIETRDSNETIVWCDLTDPCHAPRNHTSLAHPAKSHVQQMGLRLLGRHSVCGRLDSHHMGCHQRYLGLRRGSRLFADRRHHLLALRKSHVSTAPSR